MASLAQGEARAPGEAPAILEIADLHKTFGGVRAVAGASFALARGSMSALIGPNGAGKTTLFNLASGFERADRGAIRFAGRAIAGLAPHRIARLGLVRTFQLTRVFAALSVLDNMLLAVPNQPNEHLPWLLTRPGPGWRREAERRGRARELLARFGLGGKEGDYAGTLSGGQRKLLEVARALMMEPRLLLLDEPMAGINPALGHRLLDDIEALRRTTDITLLFIEHDMDVVMGRSDHVIVMAEGRVIAEGPPAAIRAEQRVVDAYLGAPRRTR